MQPKRFWPAQRFNFKQFLFLLKVVLLIRWVKPQEPAVTTGGVIQAPLLRYLYYDLKTVPKAFSRGSYTRAGSAYEHVGY